MGVVAEGTPQPALDPVSPAGATTGPRVVRVTGFHLKEGRKKSFHPRGAIGPSEEVGNEPQPELQILKFISKSTNELYNEKSSLKKNRK